MKTSFSKIESIANSTNFIDTFNLSLKIEENHVNYNPSTSQTLKKLDNNLPYLWNLQWDMKKITNDGRSYGISEGSKQTVVGIIDSGVHSDHPDLKGSVISSKNFVPNGGLRGEEPLETGDPGLNIDYTGHGTFSAGQISANGLMKGIAPEVGIKSYRVFGGGGAETVWVINAILEAVNDDVDVINLSLGKFLVKGTIKNHIGGVDKEDLAEIKAYKKVIDYANQKGSIVVAAIGNQSLDLRNKDALNEYWENYLREDEISYAGKLLFIPAQLPKVISVSSLGPTDELSTFSNYGKNAVDIATYGGDTRLLDQYGITKYFAEGLYQREWILSTTPDGGYNYSMGTSFASPKVAGALALIIDQYNLHEKPNKVINILLSKGVEKGNKDYVGSGSLNVYNALTNSVK